MRCGLVQGEQKSKQRNAGQKVLDINIRYYVFGFIPSAFDNFGIISPN
jgi:hypothetical protein